MNNIKYNLIFIFTMIIILLNLYNQTQSQAIFYYLEFEDYLII